MAVFILHTVALSVWTNLDKPSSGYVRGTRRVMHASGRITPWTTHYRWFVWLCQMNRKMFAQVRPDRKCVPSIKRPFNSPGRPRNRFQRPLRADIRCQNQKPWPEAKSRLEPDALCSWFRPLSLISSECFFVFFCSWMSLTTSPNIFTGLQVTTG